MLETCTVDTFDYGRFGDIGIQKKRKGNPGTTSKARYLDVVAAFDIETSSLTDIEQAFMYVWQLHIDGFPTVIGRTWDEFNLFLSRLEARMDDGVYLCLFVHNLSFEFQFLRGIYKFDVSEVFAVQPRRVLKCTMRNHFEFRCSYMHSNMSLDMFTSKMGAQHRKLDGAEFDYSKMRYPWTPLTERELEYCVNDVLGLVEAVKIEMEHDGDSIYTYPLTSTGYVRRDAKNAMRQVSRHFVGGQLADWHTYELLREAFRGGNTHANRYYSGLILHDVHSADISSSYPTIQCNCKFPVTRFENVGACTYSELVDLVEVRERAVLMRVALHNVRLRDVYWGCPYLARAKCRMVKGALLDNGRILEAEYLETTLTDIDLRIVLSEYDFDDLVPIDVSHARYGVLPSRLVDCTIGYYEKKTQLKNVEGEELTYQKSKEKLNSIYGMMAQDPVKQSIDFMDGEFIEGEEDPKDLLYRNNRRAFLCYQWGVWVTAWARLRLEEGIRLAGDGFVYCDTDSVKYIGNIDWNAYNARRIEESVAAGSYATDPDGVTHYMGVYEYEGCYSEFATLGAKKYCTRKEGRPLQITIAGVNKRKGGAELERTGGISAFAPGFTFRDAGGTESVYNDVPPMESVEVDGHVLPITSNVMIRDSTYTLGITAEYEEVLRAAAALAKGKEWRVC